MLSVSEAYKKAILADSRDMPYRVTLAGSVVYERDNVTHVSFNEGVSGNNGIELGTANSATVTLTIREATPIDYSGMYVKVESGLVLPDGSEEWLPLGEYWVTDFTTSNDYKTLKLTCSDGMYHLTGEYISSLKYPTDISNVVAEIVTQTGIRFSSVLPTLEIRRKPEGMTYREVLGHLAGCCGKNARFNRQGILEFVWYTDSGVTIQRKTQYMNGFTKLNPKPLEVNFDILGKEETYDITVVTDSNGNVVATPGRSVLEGEIVLLSINPANEYELADITVVSDSGETIALSRFSNNAKMFVQPDSNVTVTASFKKIGSTEHTVTVKRYGMGSIVSGGKTFKPGEQVSISVSPDEGYELETLTVIPWGLSLTAVNDTDYTFTMPDSDVTITATFAEAQAEYNITYQIDKGDMTARDSAGNYVSKAKAGSIITVILSPQDGYEFDYFDSNVTLTQRDTNVYNFIMPAEDASIVVHTRSDDTGESEAKIYTVKRSIETSDAIVITSPRVEVSTSGDKLIISSDFISVTTSDSTINITVDYIESESVTMEYTNPLIYEKMLPTIKSLVQGITYTPAKVKHRGNPALQAGDVVHVPDKNGLLHTVPIMQQTINIGGGMNSEIYCPGKTEKTKSFTENSPTQTKIKKAVEESNYEFERRLSANNSNVYAAINKDISANESRIEAIAERQDADSYSVARLEEKVSGHSASINALTEWQGTTKTSIAQLEIKANKNESNIGLIVDNGRANARFILEAINNQGGEQSEAFLSADKIQFEGKEFSIDANKINFEADDFSIKSDRLTINGKPLVTTQNNVYYIDASQVSSEGLVAQNAILGGWTLGEATILVDATGKTITASALDSGELTTQKEGKIYTYRVYLTAVGVYVVGRYDTSNESAVPYYGHKTWLDIVGG